LLLWTRSVAQTVLKMKLFLVACAVCLAVASAAPDNLVKSEDAQVVQTVASSAPSEATPKKVGKSQGTVDDRTRLLSALFTGYNKNVNPDKIKLEVGISLIDFNVIEEKNILGSYGWLKYMWEDSRLKWSPEEYGGAEVIRLDANEIWKPDVTLYNSADPVNMINCWQSNVLIYNSGKILWVPPCKMQSMCHFNLKVHPYGEQTCSWKLGSWTFDGNVLDLQMYNQTAGVDISDLNNSSGFEIISTTGERNVKYYSCCPEPYPDVTFNVTIKRIPGEELFKKLH